jgi:hypothetical protein
MLPKFIAVVDGFHFVAGVDIKQLQDALAQDDFKDLAHLAPSFLGLSKALVSLKPDQIYKMGGFAAVVQPNQVLEIPAGFISAQTSLSTTCTFVHWSTCRPDSLSWEEQIKVASDAVEHDISKSQVATEGASLTVSQAELKFLEKVQYQLDLAPLVLKWLHGRAEQKSDSRFFMQAEVKERDRISSLDSYREMLASNAALSNSVTGLRIEGFSFFYIWILVLVAGGPVGALFFCKFFLMKPYFTH